VSFSSVKELRWAVGGGEEMGVWRWEMGCQFNASFQRSHIKARPIPPTLVKPPRPNSNLRGSAAPSLRGSEPPPLLPNFAAFASFCEPRGSAL
jgi:hypothetical protein